MRRSHFGEELEQPGDARVHQRDPRCDGTYREVFFVQALLGEARRHVDDGRDHDIHGARIELGEGVFPAAPGRTDRMRRQKLPHTDVDAGRAFAQFGKQRLQEHGRDAIGRTDGEPASRGARLERLRTRDHPPGAREHVRDRLGQFVRARGRNDPLGRLQEQRIVEQPPQPAEAMTDRGRRSGSRFPARTSVPNDPWR